MFTVYVIKNSRGKIYIGQTANLEERLIRHNRILPSKKTSYTAKQGSGWIVIYKEFFDSRSEAITREMELKSSRGRAFIKQNMPLWCNG